MTVNLIAFVIFFSSGVALVYSWLGYPTIVALFFRLRSLVIEKRPVLPGITVIIAAKNEEANIGQRIDNLLELDYPPDALEILVASDGSTDGTASIVRQYQDPRIRLLEFPVSRGRAAVHNEAAKAATGEVLVFTDAETRFLPDFVKAIVSNFADARVGCVSGVIDFENQHSSTVTRQRGFYWNYEYWLRQQESRCGILTLASGPCMAVRANLFKPLEDGSYDVDFITPLDVIQAGFLVVQEERAVAIDRVFVTPKKEWQAQVRMVSRNLAGYLDRKCLMSSRQYVPFAWALVSHKVMRWATPLFQLLMLLTNLVLAVRGVALGWLALQMGFYAAAVAGWMLVRANRETSVFSVPFGFCLASAGFLFGILRCLRSERITVY